MFSNRIALLIAALMVAASIGGVVAKPSVKVSDEAPISLEKMIPQQFGDWREEPQRYVQVVNPQTQGTAGQAIQPDPEPHLRQFQRLSRHALARLWHDQRGSLQAHKPEICYPAQGFTITKNEAGTLPTTFGDIPVRRLASNLGARQEPVTYWFTVGDQVAMGTTQRKLVELRLGLTGRIPDGMLFRISSLDPDPPRAYQAQDAIRQPMLQAVPPADRQRLSGLGGS